MRRDFLKLIMATATAATVNLPGEAHANDRAKKAAAKVRPEMEKALKAAGLVWGAPVFLRAFKAEALLEAHVLNRTTGKFQHFRSWPIAAQSGKPGPKQKTGDLQVPEGFYAASRRSMNPASAYHLSFNIGYPNAFDTAHARTGSLIMIHGNRLSVGCLAMTDDKIEEIYSLCDAALTAGQPFFRIHIFPFRMSAEKMAAAATSEWLPFWQNLQSGYDWFEKHRTPPDVTVAEGKYVFTQLGA